MNPSKAACENALSSLPGKNVIAMSVLAAGYTDLSKAAIYLKTLRNLAGVVVGVSKETHAKETFRRLRYSLL